MIAVYSFCIDTRGIRVVYVEGRRWSGIPIRAVVPPPVSFTYDKSCTAQSSYLIFNSGEIKYLDYVLHGTAPIQHTVSDKGGRCFMIDIYVRLYYMLYIL